MITIPGASLGDITGVTAGTGLSGGGTDGTVTVNVDLNSLSAAVLADGDFITFIDTDDSNAPKKEALADVLDLIAGTVGTTGLDRSGATLVVTDLHPVGVSGSDNQLLTDDGDGTVTSESGLTYNGSTLAVTGAVTVSTDLTVTGGDIVYGNGQNATASVTATAHDAAGRNLTITAGPTTAGTTNNIAGGALTFQGGQGKGSGAGGSIVFQTANAAGSGSSLNSLATALTLEDDLNATFGNDVLLNTDSAVIKMGADNDVTLTHDGTTGLTVAANPFEVDSGGNITLDAHTGIFIFQDANTEVLRITEGNSGDVTIKLETNAKDLIFTDNGDATGLTIKDAAAGIVVPGEVMTTKISFTDGDDAMSIADGGGATFAQNVAIADSKFIEFESAAGTPTTDNTVQGVVIEFLATEAITQFDAVYVSTTTGRVGRADANDAAKLPAIGIAIEAQGSAGSSVRVLTHGVYRDDGGFGGNMTVGADVYVSETPGTLTTTAPGDDGDFVQIMGVAVGVRSAFINPDMTIVEVA